MKKSMSIGTLFLLLTIAIQSNAEMRITEGGVTFPDSSVQTKAVSGDGISVPLNLSGSLTTGDNSGSPDGAIISGVNTYSGGFRTYGGYFEAAGTFGVGVFGSTSASHGSGVYGSTPGSYSRGVFGSASGNFGTGVYGSTSGTCGSGVFGSASGTSGRGG